MGVRMGIPSFRFENMWLKVEGFKDMVKGWPTTDVNWAPKSTVNATETTSNVIEDPFVVLESTSTPAVSSLMLFTDPLEEISKLGNSGSTRVDGSSAVIGGAFNDLDPLEGLGKSAFPSEMNKRGKNRSPWSTEPTISTDSHKCFSQTPSSPSHVNASPNETNSQGEMSPRSEENLSSSDDVWLTVSDIPLFTQPTSAPPPSRPPPPRPTQVSRAETGSFGSNNARKKLCLKSMNLKIFPWVGLGIMLMAMQRVFMVMKFETNSVVAASAAAMKEAMDRADAKFRHAKGVRERESAKASRSKEAGQLDRDEKAMQDAQERAIREKHERLEQRAAVHRAQAEARERAAAEAKERAEKAAAEARERANTEAREKEARERAAVARAEAEVRLRTEQAAVERVAAEARERVAAEARERAAARVNQQKNENDLESFFSMSSRPSSAPRPRANSSDPMFGIQFQNRHGPEMARTSASASSTMRKASPTTNIVNDLSSILELLHHLENSKKLKGKVNTDGEPGWNVTKGLRSMQYAKALAEKNQWDLQTQREQAERHVSNSSKRDALKKPMEEERRK
ncbi:Auxilin-related protein 2 [Vitis vinifera]|uniref:Auxilin-related protein 2 n=1 Tax=Vitis vinifera TaxID=29760 RepID=A0A438G2U9_VITVI|nr:Auxilin-related protein 2 [Vitis vinifera]